MVMVFQGAVLLAKVCELGGAEGMEGEPVGRGSGYGWVRPRPELSRVALSNCLVRYVCFR